MMGEGPAITEYRSFSDMLHKSTEAYGAQILFKNDRQEWTYRQFYEDVVKVAAQLTGTKQQYIIISSEHTYYFCVFFYSAVIAGKTILLLTDHNENSEDTLVIGGTECLSFLSEDVSDTVRMPQEDIDRPCVVIKSSGTTSFSKEVMLSQKNLLIEISALVRYKPFPENEIYLHILPFSHLFGLLGEFLIPYSTGGMVCFSGEKKDLFKNLAEFRPTYMCIPPAIIEAISKMLLLTGDIKATTGGRLKTIISGGAFLNERLRTILNEHGIKIYIAYGLTECSPVISIERDGMERYGSVGQPLPVCDVRIVDDEIVVAGDTVMLGYRNDSDSTEKVMEGGYLHTGDLGYFDKDGYLYLKGRRSNLIVLNNGEKIIPEQIEARLNSISGVEESLVYGTEEDSRIMVDVIVYLTDNSDECRTEINGITENSINPGIIKNISFMDHPIKKNAMGKIDRRYYQEKHRTEKKAKEKEKVART